MSFFLAPVIALYAHALQPVPLLAWLGIPVSTLDLAGAFRLAVVLRQLRELYLDQHVAKLAATNHKTKSGGKPSAKAQRAAAADDSLEHRSRVREYVATLVIVHGGEAIAAPWLGRQPSFFVSNTSSVLFLGAHVLVDLFPTLPSPSLHTEIPLTIVHAFFRSILLCNVIPRVVAGHASPAVAASSFTLLLTAWIIPNGGPFISNLFSLLRPTPIEVATPPELLPYGWTATDVWSAPLVTGLYATLTHAQPFFTYLHALLYAFFWPLGLAHLSDVTTKSGQRAVAPVDHETARAFCAIVLCALNVNRVMRAHGPGYSAIISQVVKAASTSTTAKAAALPASSVDEEEEKNENEEEEDTADARKKGRVESVASKGELDDSR
ncbi:hypothetical protein BC827DRAFT_1236242 [Russula dissimulans]|nr:hypothetical protein BC827DRAFT_1236242 [Russula dissimulans]